MLQPFFKAVCSICIKMQCADLRNNIGKNNSNPAVLTFPPLSKCTRVLGCTHIPFFLNTPICEKAWMCILAGSSPTCQDMTRRNVCYVSWRTDKAFSAVHTPTINTESKRLLPKARPAPPPRSSPDTSTALSVGKKKPHTGMSLRD